MNIKSGKGWNEDIKKGKLYTSQEIKQKKYISGKTRFIFNYILISFILLGKFVGSKFDIIEFAGSLVGVFIILYIVFYIKNKLIKYRNNLQGNKDL